MTQFSEGESDSAWHGMELAPLVLLLFAAAVVKGSFEHAYVVLCDNNW
jgi:hypothetical protein